LNCFIDTSALIKHYLFEDGEKEVSDLIFRTDTLIVSEITVLECLSVIRRYFHEKRILDSEYSSLKKKITSDLSFMKTVQFDEVVSKSAIQLVDHIVIKSMDLIQLASAYTVKQEIDLFVSCDKKLIANANSIGMETYNPLIN